jgi:hypothetical protein
LTRCKSTWASLPLIPPSTRPKICSLFPAPDEEIRLVSLLKSITSLSRCSFGQSLRWIYSHMTASCFSEIHFAKVSLSKCQYSN